MIKKREVSKALQIPLHLSNHHKQFKAVSARTLVSPSSAAEGLPGSSLSAPPPISSCAISCPLMSEMLLPDMMCLRMCVRSRALVLYLRLQPSTGQWNTILPPSLSCLVRCTYRLLRAVKLASHPTTKPAPQVRHASSETLVTSCHKVSPTSQTCEHKLESHPATKSAPQVTHESKISNQKC